MSDQTVLGHIDHSAICARCLQFRGQHWGVAKDMCHLQGEPGVFPRFANGKENAGAAHENP